MTDHVHSELRDILAGDLDLPADHLDQTVADLVASLTSAPVGAVRETKALLLDAAQRDDDAQRLLERQAQARRFRDLAGGR